MSVHFAHFKRVTKMHCKVKGKTTKYRSGKKGMQNLDENYNIKIS